MDPTNDAINEVTAPLRTGVKIMQLAKEGAKLAKEGVKWVGGYKLIEAGSNWNTNNVTRDANIGDACRQVGLDLNENKVTVKQAVTNLKSYGVSDNLVNETIEAANRFHPEGLRYGKDCYYVTARPNPFQKQFWQNPLHVRKGWKRKNISGKEVWVKDSDSTPGDPTRRSEEQNLRGFEEQLVEPPPKQPRRPLRRPVKQSRAGGAGSSAGRGGLRGGGGAENDHSTQSQVEVMTKKAFEQSYDQEWSSPRFLGDRSELQYILVKPESEPRLITDQRLPFYQLPIVQLVLCVTLLAVYQYHRLKTLPAFGKHLKIEDQGEVNSFFSRKSLHACGRFLLRLIPYVEVDDRRTRQDLIQVFIDFNRGSLPSEQASFVLSKHFDLKKADIEELLDIK